ncbi:aryl-sulfate sulfotransferase [candidate division KSB1 bacterium]|nr:aryl-sulfate sulfotransferase [candidate division KSB1 bacterium]
MKTKSLFDNIIVIFLLSHTLLFAYQQKGYQYLSPKPGAKHVSRYSRIMVRLNTISPYQISNLISFIKVTGSESGNFPGRITIASDKRTMTFKPTNPFLPGEIVEVKLAPILNPENFKLVKFFQFQFEVAESENCTAIQPQHNELDNLTLLKPESAGQVTGARITANGVSIPSNFPQFEIGINNNPGQGFIFLSKYLYTRPFYRIILDNTGCPVWYWRAPEGGSDFKVQQNSLLTMWVGSDYDFGQGFIGLDSSYTVVDSFYAVDGYLTDEHELQVLENGHYLLIGVRETEVYMGQYVASGRPDATVKETVIQEFTASGELIFLWSPWDYFNIQDIELDDVNAGYISFPHMNAISIDDDGHILLSSRHLSEVTKINRQTGDIIWRLGGAHNQFFFINDPFDGFTNQHDIRSLGNGRYTVYDNGNLHPNQQSRAVEYEVDVDNKTATLVWQFQYSPPKFSYWMGNVQRLPNGNTLVNASIDTDAPVFTEVCQDGQKAFELWQDANATFYRIFRFPWNGKAEKPYLLVEADEKITLLFNKFGDTDVDYYRIYSGTNPNPTALLDTSKLTLKKFDGLEKGKEYYFRVTAVDKNGNESDYSNEVSQLFDPIEPGENMVKNGDFSNNSANWVFTCSYVANMSIDDGVCHINIENGGIHETLMELYQSDIKMIKGKNYLFEFDAWADNNRTMSAKIVEKNRWPDYSKIGLTYLSTRNRHFSYSFVMNEETDLNALLTFFLGNSNYDVYLDNISLKTVNESAVQQSSGQILSADKFKSYPNPFNAQMTLCFSVGEQSFVTIKLYNVLGAFVKEITNDIYEKGQHQLKFDGTDLSSGVYFCRLIVQNRENNKSFSDIHKILLVK